MNFKFKNIIHPGSNVTLRNVPEKPWIVKGVAFYCDGSHSYMLAHDSESYQAFPAEIAPVADAKKIGFEF